ncbi:MAG: hypothetical protein MUC48_03190 [Leptolyngbya sp. Prado105]|jgi:hypothetical protein|nr:hypothetical protein [Leptolyngbya sp. Prado105]
MSSSNQNGRSVATVSDEQQLSSVMNDPELLEKLLPKNLSNNKRAVIERLIKLHQQNAANH